jgi:hypothetical protein
MKIVFLGTSFSIIRYMRYDKVVKQTYDREQVRRAAVAACSCGVAACF